jgi:hypothetical protein
MKGRRSESTKGRRETQRRERERERRWRGLWLPGLW